MCNAKGHFDGCTCGFGGEGHLGKRQKTIAAIYTEFIIDSNFYKSYTNPNAKCPVCGAPVFFYQSEEGGRVYFDELGPPWPKHPCIDETSYPLAFHLGEFPNPPGWHKHNWKPFKIDTHYFTEHNKITNSFSSHLNTYYSTPITPGIQY
jgi:hypothetical protein